MHHLFGPILFLVANLFSPLALAADFWGTPSRVEASLPSGRREPIGTTLSAGALQAAGLWEGVQRLKAAPLSDRIAWVQKVTRQMIRPQDDPSNLWQSPSQTLARRSGDCEDYAILRVELLRWLGWPSSQMAVFLGSRAGSGHAVAAVSTPSGTWTLDNMSALAYLSSKPRSFQAEVGVNRQGAWWASRGRSNYRPLMMGELLLF